jgi:hypothetical protein
MIVGSAVKHTDAHAHEYRPVQDFSRLLRTSADALVSMVRRGQRFESVRGLRGICGVLRRRIRALRGACALRVSANGAASAGLVTALGVALQSVGGDRFPRCGVRGELADTRPDPGIGVECSHADADRIGMISIAAKQRRATGATEPFLAAVVRLPHAKPVLASDDPKRARCGVCARRCRRSTATLAALAMAVAGEDEWRGHFEPHGPAVAATREREVFHLLNRLLRVGASRRQSSTAAGEDRFRERSSLTLSRSFLRLACPRRIAGGCSWKCYS